MTSEKTDRLAELLMAAGWKHTGDAQWTRLEAILPEIEALLAESYRHMATITEQESGGSLMEVEEDMWTLPVGTKLFVRVE